ncbi:MAG: hypothetical protein AAFQ80_20855 [Cyanobacteria bacterium J06621_8]
MENSESRLKRIEAITESNAKAIQTLSSDLAEMKRNRNSMYLLMKNLTEKMGQLTIHQARSYELIESLDNRQNQLANQQQQLIDIIKIISAKNDN